MSSVSTAIGAGGGACRGRTSGGQGGRVQRTAVRSRLASSCSSVSGWQSITHAAYDSSLWQWPRWAALAAVRRRRQRRLSRRRGRRVATRWLNRGSGWPSVWRRWGAAAAPPATSPAAARARLDHGPCRCEAMRDRRAAALRMVDVKTRSRPNLGAARWWRRQLRSGHGVRRPSGGTAGGGAAYCVVSLALGGRRARTLDRVAAVWAQPRAAEDDHLRSSTERRRRQRHALGDRATGRCECRAGRLTGPARWRCASCRGRTSPLVKTRGTSARSARAGGCSLSEFALSPVGARPAG